MFPYGWTPTGDAEFDSLTLLMERGWFAGGEEPGDTTLPPVLAGMQRVADSQDEGERKGVMQGRASYWRGRILRKEGADSVEWGAHLSRAAALLDHLPYDRLRVAWTSEPDYTPIDGARCRLLTDQAEILEREGDLPYRAGRLMELGWMMNLSGNLDRGERYLQLADSLFGRAGMQTPRVGNGINLARTLLLRGDTAGCRRTLYTVLESPACREGDYARSIAHYNLYTLCNDTAALLQGWEEIKDERVDLEGVEGYSTMLCDVSLARGDIEGARRWMSLSESLVDEVNDPEFLRDYYYTRADLCRAGGDVAGEAAALRAGKRVAEELVQETEAEKVIAYDLTHAMEQQEAEALRARKSLTLRWLASLLAFITLAAGALIAMMVATHRRKIAAMRLNLELEQARRRALALQLALDEQTADSGADSGGKLHPSSQAFMNTFADLRPDFEKTFNVRYPGCSEASRKLAIYIALGMNIKHIAHLQGVRPESVKQARWRLRRQMGLKGEDNLDDIIKNL